jgi:hypothetical protein
MRGHDDRDEQANHASPRGCESVCATRSQRSIGVLETVEHFLLTQQHLGLDAGVVEELADRGAEDGVALLLEGAEVARLFDELRVLALAERGAWCASRRVHFSRCP